VGRASPGESGRISEDGEPRAVGAAGQEAAAVHRRRTAESGRAGQEARPKGAGGSGHDRDARYDLAMVPRARGQEIRWKRSSRPRPTSHGGQDCTAARRNGDAEHQLGLHAAARRAQERRVRGGSEHDQEDLDGAGYRAGADATTPVLVGDLHQGAPERDHRRGLLHGRSAELGRNRSATTSSS
jgi:hypothetical protein